MKKQYRERRFRDFREIVNEGARKYRRRPAFLLKSEGGKEAYISYEELKNRYYSLCEYFLRQGLIGQKIAIVGKNSPAWVLSYLAAATVGVAVPLDRELHEEDLSAFIREAECRALCAEDGKSLLLSDLPTGIESLSFSAVMALSERGVSRAGRRRVDSLTLPKNQMQILLYTSGTTGSGKGVCLSQYNICSCIHSTVRVVRIGRRDTMLSILPLHHTYECTLNCLLPLTRGAAISYCEGLTKIQKNMKEYRPTVLVFVPALLKLLAKRLLSSIEKRCPRRYRARLESEGLLAISSFPLPLRAAIRRRIKRALGGRLTRIIVGAAPLDPSLVLGFSALGIRVLQGYGLTEASPLLAGNSDFFLNAASVGMAVPGVTLSIDSPNEAGVGEILAKGDNIMLGYYRDPEATEKALKDGWLHTGDLGCLDEGGALFIKGRKKSVIVTENGKNIYPEELEGRLACFPEVSEALVLAGESNGEVCVKAKIFPNLDFIKEQLGRLPRGEEIERRLFEIVKEVNRRIPDYKRIRITEILKEGLEKTSTRKIKRYGENMG